jgi:phosphoglycerate dehydrogenase-like enzyme
MKLGKMLFLDDPTIDKKFFTHYIVNNDEKAPVRYIYTHLTTINYEDYPGLEVIICPCTGIEHLKPIPQGVELIYLNDGRWLYDQVVSTVEYNIYSIMRLMFRNRDQLAGSTIGFIGYGRVAQKIANMLEGFDIDILYIDQVEPIYNPLQLATKTTTEYIFRNCDIISIQLSENESTKDFINCEHFDFIRERLKYYGSKPYFVNTARSSIVNGEALLRAIEDDLFSGILLDVMESYPRELQNKIKSAKNDNLIISGHVAGKSHNSRLLTDNFVMLQFRRLLKEKGKEKWEM